MDSIKQLNSSEIKLLIEKVGNELGISPHWLNDQASTVSLPIGILSRAQPLNIWNSIKASLVCREDLIKMKASAFAARRDYTNKDWEDLLLLSPTNLEIENAIEFIKQVNAPASQMSQKFLNEFKETLNDLKKISK